MGLEEEQDEVAAPPNTGKLGQIAWLLDMVYYCNDRSSQHREGSARRRFFVFADVVVTTTAVHCKTVGLSVSRGLLLGLLDNAGF